MKKKEVKNCDPCDDKGEEEVEGEESSKGGIINGESSSDSLN